MGAMALVVATAVEAQPRYDRAALKSERLDRGVVAVRDGGRVIVSWRVLGSDAAGESFDVYRDGVKLNRRPLRRGGSFFVDEKPDPKGASMRCAPGSGAAPTGFGAMRPTAICPYPCRNLRAALRLTVTVTLTWPATQASATWTATDSMRYS